MTFLFDVDDESPKKKPATRSRQPKRTSADDALTIRELTSQIKSVVEKSFPKIWVRGELTDIARPRSGHVYFTLKDEHAQIRGVMWRSVAERLAFQLEDGQAVLCHGDVEVYAARGSYQLIVRKCQPEGVGSLQLAFKQLQAKLASEGLFDPERKRRLPRIPRRVAIVTSPSGAAIADFLQAASIRHAGVEIVLIPATVQGSGSVSSLVDGISAAHALQPRPDVLIVARGGGSLEDLWSFNEEPLVRALARSRIPTVSAVGHEIDVTLSDLVADVRALTPTDAASRVLPDRDGMLEALGLLQQSLRRTLEARVQRARHRLDAVATRQVVTSPHRLIHDRARVLDEWDHRGRSAMIQRLEASRSRLTTLAASTSALSPLNVLARGYSVTQTDDGRVVRDAETVQRGDVLRTRVQNGEVKSVVESYISD